MADSLAGVVTPEVNAPAADAVPVPDAPTDQEQAEQQESVQPKTLSDDEHKELVEKRVNERLTKERKRLERSVRAELERDFYKQQLESTQKPPQQTQQPPGKPKHTDYADWESYNEALTDWKVEQRLGKLHEETTAQQQQRQAREAEAQFAKTINENFKAAAEKYADFVDVVTADGLPFHNGSPILAYVAKSKAGGEIAYHLGNDRAEADRIAQLHPIDQVLALRDLEVKLTAPPRPTNTSAPIVPSKGNSTGSKSMLDMTQEEFEKHRAARLAKKR